MKDKENQKQLWYLEKATVRTRKVKGVLVVVCFSADVWQLL